MYSNRKIQLELLSLLCSPTIIMFQTFLFTAGKFYGFIIFVLFAFHLNAQPARDSILKLADNFYLEKKFPTAASLYSKAGSISQFKANKQGDYYNAACCYALAKDKPNAYKYLRIAIASGYNNLEHLKVDTDLESLHKDKKWAAILKSVKPAATGDPLASKVIDSDVKNFWTAYDLAKKDTAHAVAIYQKAYIGKATPALEFYYVNKIGSLEKFIQLHNQRKKYYKSIRASTLKAATLKDRYQKSFAALKNIYPNAMFPNIYFVIGRLRSGGTVSKDGLILGIDQAAMSPHADTTELSDWEKHNISRLADLPYTVAHELIHYQQNGMADDTTLLKGAILEGMADFIGELISGKTSNERLKIFMNSKEKQQRIWNEFKKEMYLNRSNNWIANSEQETPDRPADLGYWVGYEICKAYYENAADKQQAIDDMLHIKDYRAFLEKSKLDEKIAGN